MKREQSISQRFLSIPELWFLIGLGLLLINDFFFKNLWPNLLTGKLSDFAGLLIFPWFWSMILPRWSKTIYILTALLFVFWKMEWSDYVISSFNDQLGFHFSRVSDLTDLWSLSILPFSYRLFKACKVIPPLVPKVAISALSIFAFFATSQPRVYISPNWDFDESYEIPFAKNHLLTERMWYRNGTLTDSTILSKSEFVLNFYHSSINFECDVSMEAKDSLNTLLTLKKLVSYEVRGTSKKKEGEISKTEFLQYFGDIVTILSIGSGAKSVTYWEKPN